MVKTRHTATEACVKGIKWGVNCGMMAEVMTEGGRNRWWGTFTREFATGHQRTGRLESFEMDLGDTWRMRERGQRDSDDHILQVECDGGLVLDVDV